MRNHRRPAPAINPRNLRKRQIAEHKVVRVAGDRERTPTGFKISGYVGAFEIFYEVFAATAASDWLRQLDATQVRVARVLEGSGFFLESVDGAITQTPLAIGDEIVIEGSRVYRFVTTAHDQLDLLVIQTPQYGESLVVTEASDALVHLPASALAQVGERPIVERTHPSRAREQLQELQQASHLVRNLKARDHRNNVPGLGKIEAVANPSNSTTVEGINPRPSGGQFDPSMAG